MDFDELLKIHRNEKNKKNLQKLPETFYEDCKKLIIENIKKYEETKELSYLRKVENIKTIIKAILFLRQQKIVFSALRLAVANEEEIENITEKEKGFFKDLHRLISENIKLINDIVDNIENTNNENKKEIDQKKENEINKDINTIKIKILVNIPRFLNENGEEIGPFEKDQIVEINQEIADHLIQKNFAVRYDA